MKVLLTLLCSLILCSSVAAKERFTEILIVGVDSRTSGFQGNTDVMCLASMNENTKKVKLCSFYRDTLCFVGSEKVKLNAVYHKFGIAKLISVINELYDLDIKKYVIINWKSTVDCIDKLGKVQVNITQKEFEYMNAFITETAISIGKDPSKSYIKQAGMNNLDGVGCVAYGRLRLMDTDYNRTERQKVIMYACMDKVKKLDINKIINLVPIVLKSVKHNLSILQMVELARSRHFVKITDHIGFPDKFDKLNDKSAIYPKLLSRTVMYLHEYLYEEKHIASNKVIELEKKYKEIT